MGSYRRLSQLHQLLKRSYAHKSSCTPQAQKDIIQVTPKVSCFDSKVHIKVQGLPQEAKVTVHASTETEWQRRTVPFVSCGHYIANNAGEVDLWKDTSLGGSYQGVEPMGLFWSLAPSPSSSRSGRMVIKNVLQPVVYNLSVFLDHMDLTQIEQMSSDCQPVSSIALQRYVLEPSVRRIPVKEGTVRGVLFLPPGEGPFQGVVDMFGLAGGLMEGRAALLASNGFAVFALPFCQYDDLPQDFRQQTFEYFENAVRWLASHPSVRQGGIGVIGTSGGASFASLMAWKCPQVKALVRVNGAGYCCLMDMYHKGELMCRPLRLDTGKTFRKEGGLVLTEAWLHGDADPIPTWERDVHLLVLMSDDDHQVPPYSADMQYNLYPQDRRHLVEVVHYPRAGHLLEPPYTPLCRVCFNPFFSENLMWGGYPKEHGIAQEDAWRRVLEFFHTHLPA